MSGAVGVTAMLLVQFVLVPYQKKKIVGEYAAHARAHTHTQLLGVVAPPTAKHHLYKACGVTGTNTDTHYLKQACCLVSSDCTIRV